MGSSAASVGRRGRLGRRGFTLVEAVTSLGLSAIVLVALGSVVVIASRALPSRATPAGSAASAALAADRLASEAAYAKTVLELEEDRIAFTIADQTSDGVDETVRYMWDEPAGVVTRTFNGTTAPLISGVSEFELASQHRRTSVASTTTETRSSGDTPLVTFTSWPLLTPVRRQLPLSSLQWAGVNWAVSLPQPRVTRLRISTVQLRLQSVSGSSTVLVAVHLPTAAGSGVPQTAAVGTPATIPGSSLSSTPSGWVTASFTDVVFTGTIPTELIFVVRGASGPGSVLNVLSSPSAPTGSPFVRWTSNQGAVWQPVYEAHTTAAPVVVTGEYEYLEDVPTTVDVYHLRALTATVRQGTGAWGGASSRVWNAPRLP